ncbi:phage tail protein [Enterococcus sp. DIV2454a]|uniref:phage tail protein n=1 Tax=unclassified Enterococcus TaxID=2608891 RepID=UPI003F264414
MIAFFILFNVFIYVFDSFFSIFFNSEIFRDLSYFYIKFSDDLYKLTYDGLIATSAAILALLVPISFFLIENIGNKNSGSIKWDKTIIFKYVIGIKTLVALSFITFTLIFWDFLSIRPLLFFIYLSGVIMMFYFFRRCYKWIMIRDSEGMNYRNKLRIKMLGELREDRDLDIWITVLESNFSIVDLDEKEILSMYVKYYKDRNSYEIKSQLLLEFIKNITITFKNSDVFHRFVFEVVEDCSSNRDSVSTLYVFRVCEFFESYLKSLESDEGESYHFAAHFKEFVTNNDVEDLEYFLMDKLEGRSLFNFLYDHLDCNAEWVDKIIKSFNDTEKETLLESIYLLWIRNMYSKKEKEIDNVRLSNLTEKIFNELNMTIFFNLLNFALYLQTDANRYGINNREQAIADYVNSKKRFYGFDKGFVFWGDQAVEELNNIRDKTTYKYFVESNHPEFDPFHRPKFLQDIIDILNSMNDDKTHVLEGQLTKLKEAINE